MPYTCLGLLDFCKVQSNLSIYQDENNTLLLENIFYPLNDQCSHHIETSQLICRANQLTGFYIMGTLVVKGIKDL